MDENEMKVTEGPAIDAETVIQIARHYCHAKSKHPYFADRLFIDEANATHAGLSLKISRTICDFERKSGKAIAETLAECEIAEACDALARGDKAAAVAECYDAIAVLLRIIDVIEGRQALGKPKEEREAAK